MTSQPSLARKLTLLVKLFIDAYSAAAVACAMLGAITCGLTVVNKWKQIRLSHQRRKHGATMKDFMDVIIATMLAIDHVLALVTVFAVLFTWRLYYYNQDSPVNHWIWWIYAQLCWLPQYFHTYIATVCYNWVVRKYAVSKLQKSFRSGMMITATCFVIQTTLSIVVFHYTGDTTKEQTVAFVEYFSMNLLTFSCMLFCYASTIIAMGRELRKGQRVSKAYRNVVRQFMMICGVFLIVWGSWCVVIFTWWYTRLASLYLTCSFTLPVYLHPLLDSIIMGKVHHLCRKKKVRRPTPRTVASVSLKALVSRAPMAPDPFKSLPAKLFVSTLNCGGVKDVGSLGDPRQWIPLGFDMYCIGLQECLILQDVKRVIHRLLGGPGHYTVFQREIGDTKILQGLIALVVFAKTDDVNSGAFTIIESISGEVASGANLGLIQAANKGMVGFSDSALRRRVFRVWPSARLHDSTLAFISAHYAADAKGQCRLNKRNLQAQRTLRDLILVDNARTEFDVHLQHHHTIVFGDLNYRIQGLEPMKALELIAKSGGIEAHQRSQMGDWSSQDPSTSTGWVREQYLRFFEFGDNHLSPHRLSTIRATFWTSVHDGSLVKPSQTLVSSNSVENLEAAEKEEQGEGDDDEDQEDEDEDKEQDAGKRVSMDLRDTRAVTGMEAAEVEVDTNGEALDSVKVGKEDGVLAMMRDLFAGLLYPWRVSSRRKSRSKAKSSSGGETRGPFSADSSHSSSAVMRGTWEWVTHHDELVQEMKEGRVFAGFSEGILTFPPSFRWKPGKLGGDFNQMEILKEAYSTQKRESGDGKRCPSYTDRVVYYSLPDNKSNLHLLHYTMCDSITGSDHRPVCAAFALFVNRKVVGFHTEQEDMPGAPTSLRALLSKSMTYLSNRASLAGMPKRPPRAFSDYSTPGPGPEEVTSQGPIHPSAPVPLAKRNTSTSAEESRTAVWSIKLTDFEIDSLDSLIVPTAKLFVTVHFPLVLEDPFIQERRMRQLDETVNVNPDEESALESTLGNLEVMKGASVREKQQVHALLSSDLGLLPNIHRCDWEEAKVTGISFKTIVVPEVSRHALIKLNDGHGNELGQGVMNLRDAISGKAPLLKRLVQGASGRVGEGHQLVELDLTTGGQVRGRMRFRVRLSRRSYTSMVSRQEDGLGAGASRGDGDPDGADGSNRSVWMRWMVRRWSSRYTDRRSGTSQGQGPASVVAVGSTVAPCQDESSL